MLTFRYTRILNFTLIKGFLGHFSYPDFNNLLQVQGHVRA